MSWGKAMDMECEQHWLQHWLHHSLHDRTLCEMCSYYLLSKEEVSSESLSKTCFCTLIIMLFMALVYFVAWSHYRLNSDTVQFQFNPRNVFTLQCSSYTWSPSRNKIGCSVITCTVMVWQKMVQRSAHVEDLMCLLVVTHKQNEATRRSTRAAMLYTI